MAGSLRTIVRNSVLIASGLILGNVSSLIFRLAIARVYGPSSFGVFSIGFMFVSITTTVAVFGLPAGVTRYVSRYRSTGKEQRIPTVVGASLAISLGLGVLLTIVLVIWGQPIARHVLNSPDSARFIRWFAFQIPANAIILITAAFALGHERGGMQIAVKEVSPKLLVLGFAVGIIVTGGSIFDVGLGYVVARWIAAAVGLAVTLYLLISSDVIDISVTEPADEARELLLYSSPLLLTTFTGFFLNWIDTFLVAFYLSDAKVGVYQTAFILGTSLSLFFAAISESLFPNFSALLGEENGAEVSKRYAEGVRWALIITAAPFFYLLVFPEVSLGMLFGQEFAIAGGPMVIILAGQFLGISFGPSTGLLKSIGDTRFIFYTYIAAALLNLLGNYFLIPMIGLHGAAVSTATATVVQSFIIFRKSDSIISLKLPLNGIIRTLFAGVISGTFFLYTYPDINSINTFMFSILAYSVLYILVSIASGSIRRNDIRTIQGSILQYWK